jgi:hypothetical protein
MEGKKARRRNGQDRRDGQDRLYGWIGGTGRIGRRVN